MSARNLKLQTKDRVSNLILYIGVGITLAALIYMIGNLHRADSIITIWMPFMVAGLGLSFTGGVIMRIPNKQNNLRQPRKLVAIN